jgi:hypothetical protein
LPRGDPCAFDDVRDVAAQTGRRIARGREPDRAQFLRTEDDFGVSLKSTLKTDTM